MMKVGIWLYSVLLVSWGPVDVFLEEDMARLMVVNVPLLLLMGVGGGAILKPQFKGLEKIKPHWAFPGLLFSIGTILFWMIPRSLDLAVESNLVDALLHFSLIAAGGLLFLCLPHLPFFAQMAVGIYLIAMWGGVGLILSQSSSQICARFSLAQQQAAGSAMLWAAGLWLIVFSIAFIRLLIKLGPPAKPVI